MIFENFVLGKMIKLIRNKLAKGDQKVMEHLKNSKIYTSSNIIGQDITSTVLEIFHHIGSETPNETKVQEIIRYTGMTEEKAKIALEKNNDDVLEATMKLLFDC